METHNQSPWTTKDEPQTAQIQKFKRSCLDFTAQVTSAASEAQTYSVGSDLLSSAAQREGMLKCRSSLSNTTA